MHFYIVVEITIILMYTKKLQSVLKLLLALIETILLAKSLTR